MTRNVAGRRARRTRWAGARLPACSTDSFPTRARTAIPEALGPTLGPVLDVIAAIRPELSRYDRRLETLAATRYPETTALRQVPGVGALTALSYVLTLEDPARFPKSRVVGSYLGLRPKQRDSGESAPALRITKRGDAHLRRLLVGSAHYILGPFGPDADLRRWGLTLAARGGKNAKKRAGPGRRRSARPSPAVRSSPARQHLGAASAAVAWRRDAG